MRGRGLRVANTTRDDPNLVNIPVLHWKGFHGIPSSLLPLTPCLDCLILMDPSSSKEIFVLLHADWGHCSPQTLHVVPIPIPLMELPCTASPRRTNTTPRQTLGAAPGALTATLPACWEVFHTLTTTKPDRLNHLKPRARGCPGQPGLGMLNNSGC